MLTFAELDKTVRLAEQMGSLDAGPVVLLNIFHVPPESLDAYSEWIQRTGLVMQRQPGYISTQLHRGVGGSCTFFNYAVWESIAAFKLAFTSGEFRAIAMECPDGTVGSPHLFHKVAMPGLCVA